MSNKQRSATERLNDLEQLLGNLYQTTDNMARDLLLMKEAIKLLGNKLDAVAKIANASDSDQIAAIMTENNVAELKGKVDNLISQGILVAEDTVTAQSFIVGKEYKPGTEELANPRLQFTVGALDADTQAKLIGAKAGQKLSFSDNKFDLEIVETYGIQVPKAPEVELPVDAATPEAPAAEAASS